MFPFYILLLGLSGITAQILLLRSILTTAQGNEMAVGLILGIWVIGESLGSFSLSKTLKDNPLPSFFLTNLLFSLLFPLTLFLLFFSRKIFGLTFGEILILPHLFLLSLFTVLPLSLLHGALFPITTQILAAKEEREAVAPIGKTYILENGGTILGGIFLYFLLLPHLTPFQVAFLLSALNFFILFLLKPKHSQLFLLPFSLFTSLFFLEPKLRPTILSFWWQGEKITHYENTKYGNITITKKEGEYTLFYDGFPISTVPNPEVTFIEEIAHFSLLAHPQPKTCLLIGQGIGGLIREILKHPITSVDYLELDPKIITAYKNLNLPLTREELFDPRVNLFYQDGRKFLTSSPSKRYDLIIINQLLPLTLNFNRYFTKEFYWECRKKLKADGLLVTISPSSLSYISEPLRDLILTHHQTLKSCFPYLYLIFGDINIYIASPKEQGLNPDTFQTRLLKRNLSTKVFSREYLKTRLAPHYYQKLEEILSDTCQVKAINQDLKPKGFLKSLIYLTNLSSPKLPKIYQRMENTPFTPYLLFPLFFFLFALLSTLHQKRRFIPFILFATGFWGMMESILLINLFQMRFGYLFNRVTLLFTSFLFGSTMGGFFSLRLLTNQRPEKMKRYLLLVNELFILLLSFLILTLTELPLTQIGGEILIFAAAFLSGLFLGFQFPLANSLCLSSQSKVGESVGLLFAADLTGGAFSAFFGSLLFIPIFGIICAQSFVLVLKLFSLILVVLSIITENR
ncbi:MAG: hypothetical protein ABIK94_06250 [candidate division WOR-3 bacterium]